MGKGQVLDNLFFFCGLNVCVLFMSDVKPGIWALNAVTLSDCH